MSVLKYLQSIGLKYGFENANETLSSLDHLAYITKRYANLNLNHYPLSLSSNNHLSILQYSGLYAHTYYSLEPLQKGETKYENLPILTLLKCSPLSTPLLRSPNALTLAPYPVPYTTTPGPPPGLDASSCTIQHPVSSGTPP